MVLKQALGLEHHNDSYHQYLNRIFYFAATYSEQSRGQCPFGDPR